MPVSGGQYVSFQQVRDSFIRNGLPPSQATNFASVFMKEGSVGGQGYTGSFGNQPTENGGVLNPGGAYGLGQLNAERQGGLATHAQSLGLPPSSLDAQTSFAIKEAGQRGVDLNSISSIVNKYEVPAQQYRAGEIAGATRLAAGAGSAPSGMLAQNQVAGPGASYAPPTGTPYAPGTDPNNPANWYRADPSAFKDEGITGPSPTSPMAAGGPTPPPRPTTGLLGQGPDIPAGGAPTPPSRPSPYGALGPGPIPSPPAAGPAPPLIEGRSAATSSGSMTPYGALGSGPAGAGSPQGPPMPTPMPSPGTGLVGMRSAAQSSPYGALGSGPAGAGPNIPPGGAPMPPSRPSILGQPVAPSAPGISAPGVAGATGSPSGPAAPSGMLTGPQQPTMPVGAIPQAAPPPMPAPAAPAAPAPAAPSTVPTPSGAQSPANAISSGLGSLIGGMTGGGGSAPAPMPPPTLQSNRPQIAQMAPQLMASLMQQQQQLKRPIAPMPQYQDPYGLSLGGYYG